MKIVASNSLTVSNVNDGTITHYAYANSADGTDGFYVGGATNLLQGTQDFSGSNWLNLGSSWIKTDETYNGLSVVETTSDWSGIAQYYQVKQGETYTFSLFARYTSGTGTSNFYIRLNSDSESGHENAQIYNETLACSLDTNWKKCSITFTAASDGYVKPRMERSNNNTNVLRVCGFMFEEGTVAHPWSPAPSEAHPSYIGQYTDFNTTASTDPAKYAPWIVFKGKDGLKGDTGGILGENMWIGHKYSYSGSTRIYPSFEHIQGITPVATRIFDDSTQFTFNDDYYIAHFQSNLYVNIDKQITTTVAHDDDLTIYCNDEVVVSKNSTIPTAYNITFNLKAGWNKIDILLHEISGGDYVTFGTKLSSLVEHLSYIKGADGNNSYTHTAYSWSADGKDGFTTVYPNLNLGDNTKTFAGAEGSNNLTGSIRIDSATQKTQDGDFYYLTAKAPRDNFDWFRFFLIPGPSTPNMTKVAVIPNTNYTFSVWLKGTGQHTIYAYNSWTAPNTPWSLQVNLTSDWKLYTFTVTSKDAIPNNSVQFFIRSNTGTEINLKLPKVEQGSTVTPWMPSSNEVKTSDYPSYIGTYSDSNVESSLDYRKYQWAIFKGQNSNAYTAYSWSADGTDRFSTVYPNLNLLNGSSKPFIMGYGIPNTTWDTTNQVSGISLPITVVANEILPQSGTEFRYTYIPGTTYTQSIYISTDAPLTGTPYKQTWFTNEYGHDTSGVDNLVKVSENVYRATSTLTWSSNKTSANGRNADLSNLPLVFDFTKGTFLKFYKPKLELGSIATPYMPSESEAQEQWQDAIPMYVGVGEKDSQNPSDYRWQLNPRYVQASSDSGLSNKAGVDDLASVANTANNALVQAQNAVSNEDYTSWLEHGYQSTIKNLQDVSAQNQKDIKNVDDRTTIVEGFYGEMKVKWNFIDESFSFSEEGMFISNAQSKMSIQITSDKIVFWDNNVDVAFITGEVLNIQKGVFLESATIGNHLITKFSDSSPVTIIRYVGGIT